MRLAWLTDPHFPHYSRFRLFFEDLIALDADGYLITGDIGTAHTTSTLLAMMEGIVQKPIYFIYGNHDYYDSSFDAVYKHTRELTARIPNLHWLSECGVIELTSGTALVGHDGWADGRFGSWEDSALELNDYYFIEELANLTKPARLAVMQRIAGEAAESITQQLSRALTQYAHVIVATHAPPFREVCWHMGKISDDEGLPHFSSKVMGEAILACAAAHPEKKITVLCGHTHSAAEAQMAPNVYAIAGEARYGMPTVQRVFEF